MAIAKMRKVLLVGEAGLREDVIKKLADAGIFQSVLPEDGSIPEFFQKTEIKTTSIEENLTKLEATINFLRQFEEKKFELGLFPSKILVKSEEYSEWIKDSNWEKICQNVGEIERKIEKLKEEENSLSEEYTNILPWRKLSFPVNKFKTSKYIDVQLGIIPAEAKTFLSSILKKEAIHVQILDEVARKVYILFIFLKEERAKVENLFQSLRGEKIKLKEDLVPSVRIKEIKDRIKQIKKEREDLLEKAEKLNQEKVKLMAIYDYFYELLKERKVNSHSHLSRYTFILEGWIKEEDIPTLKNVLSDLSRVEIIVKKPTKKEEAKAPVALSNRRLFKPFELVTELYGLPRYIEIDPTPFLAPFFALFLALCLTDGGYGITLVLLSYIIPKKFQVGEGGKKLFSMLFISGLLTIVIGIITGGIFGIEIQQLPAFLNPIKKLAIINPMKEPMIFLVIALGVGVIHLLTGITLELKDNLQRGRVSSAILDQLSWIVLIIGLLLVGIPFVKGFISGGTTSSSGMGSQIPLTLSPSQLLPIWKKLPVYSRIGTVMVIAGGLVLFLFSGRRSKKIGMRLAKGAYELYGVIQLFADVLSYSRLLAMGLATSVIATVVNIIAGMAGGIPVLGPIAMIFILILGHLGNIMINTLSGFIHTARLQFVEFFGKFYEGGGKKFEPLRREGKYTIII